MSILAKQPDLEKIISKAVKRIGENHALARDNKGGEFKASEIEEDRKEFRKGRTEEVGNETMSSVIEESLKAAIADKKWWENEIKVKGIWGSSAGSSKNGYGVDATGKNHYRIVHAPSVAGFAPFKEEYKNDFEKILKDYPEIIQRGDNWSIAWRHSIKYPDWPAKTIQTIDASPLLYGLAALHPKLGYKFFQKNSQYKN